MRADGATVARAASPATPSPRGRLRRNVIYGVLVLVLVALVELTVRLWVGESHGALTTALKSDQRPYQVASVDQAVSMLITVQLSLFVLVGFVFREPLAKGHRLTRPPFGGFVFLASALVFLGAAFVSVTLGYAARMQVLEFVDRAYPEFSGIETTITNQALGVAVSAISAVLMMVIFLRERDPAQGPDAGGPGVAIADKKRRNDDAMRESDAGTCCAAHVNDAVAGSSLPAEGPPTAS